MNVWNFAVYVKMIQPEHAKSKGETTKDFSGEKVILTSELLAYFFRLVAFYVFIFGYALLWLENLSELNLLVWCL